MPTRGPSVGDGGGKKVSWDKVMNGGATITQEGIKTLASEAMEELNSAQALEKMAQNKLKVLQVLCLHPNRKGYVCPDCLHDDQR